MQVFPTDFSIYQNPPVWAIPPAGMSTHGTDHLASWITRQRFYEAHILEVFKPHMPTEGVFIDIGANIGNHTLMFDQAFPGIEIHSIEASPYNFMHLYKNTQARSNMTAYCIGLSNRTEVVEFSHYADDFGSSGVSSENDDEKAAQKKKMAPMNILLVPFDSILFPTATFIKIDVENYEIPVLQGMNRYLADVSPMLWIEDHRLEKGIDLENSPTKWLEKVGYEPIVRCECNVLLKKK